MPATTRSRGRGATSRSLERSAPYSYWREEVDTVLRGRDVRSLDDYLVLERVGRGSRLGHVQRGIVWHLAQSYAANLASSGLVDWNDVLRLARDEARRLPPEPTYDAVVLDEAQDMPLLAGQLLVAIAPGGGLLFVGDDGQRVFPGGFRLSECGVDVTGGRSVRFTRNYRAGVKQHLRDARRAQPFGPGRLRPGGLRPGAVATASTGAVRRDDSGSRRALGRCTRPGGDERSRPSRR